METYAASVLAQVQIAYHASPLSAYLLIAFGTTFLGNLVAVPGILLGFDGSLGDRGLYGVPLAALAGHLCGDLMWFALGRALAKTRPGEWIRRQFPANPKVDRFISGGSAYVMAASKLFAAPTVPILFTLGWYHVSPARYARLSLISAAVWFAGVLAFCGLVYSGIRIVF